MLSGVALAGRRGRVVVSALKWRRHFCRLWRTQHLAKVVCLRTLSKKDRVAVWFAFGGKCNLCEDVLPFVGKWHVDHIKAYCKGGPTSLGNSQLLCVPCNLRKGSKDVQDFYFPTE